MDLNQHKKEFDKILEHFRVEAASIRTGRAASSLVDEIIVENYGARYKMKELATITIPEHVLLFLTAALFIPMIIMWMKLRKRGKKKE